MMPLETLAGIFRDTLEEDPGTITRETRLDQIGGWDSVVAIKIFGSAERVFGIRLSIRNYMAAKNVGEILDMIVDLKKKC